MLPPASTYFRSLLEMGAALQPRVRTLAVLAGNSPFTLLVAQGSERLAKRLGYDIVYFERFPVPTNDLSAFLTQAKAKAPDMVLVTGLFQESLQAIK